MNLRFFLLFIISILSIDAHAQSQLEKVVGEFINRAAYRNASVGIDVRDLNAEKTVFELNAEKLLIPASTMKLVTSATALEILGADYRFETKVGYIGEIEKNNTLHGNLVLIGGADPTLGSEYFQDHYFQFLENWAQKIKAAGIEKINGDLILDASVYDTEKVPATWIWEDIGNYYGAGANAFTVYDNLFRITFGSPKKAGKASEIKAVYPKIEGLTITNDVVSADNNSDNAYVFGSPLDKTRTIRGTIPRNRKAFTIKAAIHQPEQILADEFLNVLAKNGVFISGKIGFEKVDQKEFKTIFIQESPTLSAIVKVLNYESVNLFAEHFLKQLAVKKSGVGKREEGIQLVKEFWEEKGISAETFFMEDGSGLSHFNAVSPRFFTILLAEMAQNESFVQSLPRAGDGTLSRFSSEIFPGNTLKAKSGSMTRVRCYSGYLKSDSGKYLAFSIMVNHFSGSHSELIVAIENLLAEIKKQ